MTKYDVYYCHNCEVKFAVSQEFEDQSGFSCPNCAGMIFEILGEAAGIE